MEAYITHYRSITWSQRGKEHLQKILQKEANWIGHIFHRTCLLKHITKGKIQRMGRRGRRRKQLQDDHKETR
jgi:hypothetical protein